MAYKLKTKTACTNKEGVNFADNLNITTIQDIIILYYAVAIMVSPPKPEADKLVRKETVLPCKEKLEKR
eukprot:9431399-Ditylum_brightwellii.AAC.1